MQYHPRAFAMTGGTGALGFYFLRHIFAERSNVRVHLLVRPKSPSFLSATFQSWLAEYRDRITLIEGDVRDLDALSPKDKELLFQTDGGLWHSAAVTALNHEPEMAKSINLVNYECTVKLVKMLFEHGGNLFHISTAYVVGDREGLVMEKDLDCGQKFRNPYEQSKFNAEKIVWAAIAEGKPATIIRPSIVIGDDAGLGGFKVVDACAYSCGQAFKRGEPFVFRLGEHAGMNLVHPSFVTKAMLDLARLPQGHGQCYHLTAPRATTWMELGQLALQWVPGLVVRFEPNLERRELPSASKLFDKSITDVRPYLDADVVFDRTNVLRDLSPSITEPPIDLQAFVAARIQTEMAREKK